MTTSFTETQRQAVDHVLDVLTAQILAGLNHAAIRIRALDDRPLGVYNPCDPADSSDNYRFPYVAQGMLEDLIERLQAEV